MKLDLEKLLEAASKRKLQGEELNRQRVSFAFGNSGMEIDEFTRATVRDISEEIMKRIEKNPGLKGEK